MSERYENMSHQQFELLVVALCQHLLGMGVSGYAQGPDGGLDGLFEGIANLYPSEVSPWQGKVGIQVKHSLSNNASFSDSGFFSETSGSCVIAKEIPNIRRLYKDGVIEHYMLFSNRRLTALTAQKLKKYLSDQCGIAQASIALIGLEQLDLYLKQFPQALEAVRSAPGEGPLIVSPDDLAEIIEALANQKETFGQMEHLFPVERVSYERKNQLNAMTPESGGLWRREWLPYAYDIHSFFESPDNLSLIEKYEAVVSEFNHKIFSKRKDFTTFDEVLEHLYDLLLNRDPILKKHWKLTRAVLFYLYWNCDIGVRDDSETE